MIAHNLYIYTMHACVYGSLKSYRVHNNVWCQQVTEEICYYYMHGPVLS